MRKSIIIIISLLALVCTAQGKKCNNINEIKDIIVRVNDAWQQSHGAPEYGGSKRGMSAFWDNAVYHTGNMEVVKLMRELNDTASANKFYNYSLAWAERNNWCGATEKDSNKWKYKNYGEKPEYVLFGDWQICFQTYIDLYQMNNDGKRDERWISRAKEVMEYEMRSEQTDYWWWADALYMVMPVMTKMYLLTGDDGYLQKMVANWKYANSIMYDNETGLYFRDGKYVYPEHKTAAGKKDYWARGDGWVMAAFAKVLDDTKNGKQNKEIKEYYQRMAKAVIDCQQKEGHWTRSMADPEQAPGYETSGTALMCYSLFWGINNGVLPKKYKKAALKAWHYLQNVALQSDNTIGYVQPIGEKAIPGQVVDMKSQANFGTGAFLLAAAEYARFLKK